MSFKNVLLELMQEKKLKKRKSDNLQPCHNTNEVYDALGQIKHHKSGRSDNLSTDICIKTVFIRIVGLKGLLS